MNYRAFVVGFVILFLSGLCSSCIFIPQKNENQPYATECNMMTKQLALKHSGYVDLTGCADEACLFAMVAVPVTSLVVSGSIVVVGNSLHWLEYQGTCEESVVSRYLERFKNELKDRYQSALRFLPAGEVSVLDGGEARLRQIGD